MNEMPTNAAALRRPKPDIETGLRLTLRVTDAEVLAELNQRTGDEQERYALTALRVGVIALRQAGGVLDSQTLRHEGDRLVAEVEKRLVGHANDLDKAVQSELSKYFADDGKLHERVKSLTSDRGELANLLRSHIGGNNSELAKQLAEAVGKNSPLMKYLSPTEQDGLIAKITGLAQEKLEEQSKKVLSEFDLNNENSALKRLIRQIETNFDPENESSALGIIGAALEQTRDQIKRDLTLDKDDSALSLLHARLSAQLELFAKRQTDFQQSISEQLGIRQVQARTTEGGFGFEHAVGEELKCRALAFGDVFESTGELRGEMGRLTGDHVQTLGEESACPGGRVVFECKRDQKYRLQKAREELDEARKNRQATVGVFVMSAQTLREQESLRAEYPAALARYGNDVVVVWDPEDSRTSVNLDAAVGLARALVMRSASDTADGVAADLPEMEAAVTDLDKQVERFEKMSKTCDSISKGAESIKDELAKVAKRIDVDCRRLMQNIESLREASGEAGE